MAPDAIIAHIQHDLKACIAKELEQMDLKFGADISATMPDRIKAVIAACG
ncbi:hypothetical protein PHYBLDRAFT_153085 [Phycomyces blakesleeanus NRRL 1555(-)]|uniref:Uncharacterized protein n=1 Tax=Phycomyces blakesleeanus (strain ATCC 8743b / DSM 1359 / FGSC 10004 / NBRC 33097 / NRRL 1555) TaxID=763407 RepID=A0A167JEC4_PHYB8|nr:hypothetical protein PHYBLDRAFT_153085 [Phycomyces blakesleeanus NRRL 1555(-)]OAD65826.1 hypothetical protein PHYBLDRAFT_153085 [Phycomyces blakesleeanus NRRL 1555(-)]|eukprot:XP_018283866.1 hypothetical protein PHYBLDRAFT_153085 [Phycomyces blakesleeanus NRRL 1555(-)]